MKFTLKQITVFDAIADEGSVSHAAQKNSMTQSAASMALLQLESGLGKPLFERQGKRLRLNQWGYWLRPRAKRLLADVHHISLGFNGQHVVSGELALVASQTIAEKLVPDLICTLDRDFPQLRINLTVLNTEQSIEGLLNYHFQVGIIEGPCSDERVEQLLWCKDRLVIIASPNHPFSNLPEVRLDQLEEARWVLREPGSGARQAFDISTHEKLQVVNVWREYGHVPALTALVQHGPYLSCLPYRSVKKHLDNKELIALNVPELVIYRQFSFIWRKADCDNPLRECVIRVANRMFKT